MLILLIEGKTVIRKNILILAIGIFYFFISNQTVSATHIGPKVECRSDDPTAFSHCEIYNPGYSCLPDPSIPPSPANPVTLLCQEDPLKQRFGKIQAPAPLADFLKVDPTGRFAISQYLSNLIVLIYSVAFVVLIFMFLWGAFDWIMSGGEKEKVEAARRRIFYAIIGVILFAIAFAVIRILGAFTGFKFFVGQ